MNLRRRLWCLAHKPPYAGRIFICISIFGLAAFITLLLIESWLWLPVGGMVGYLAGYFEKQETEYPIRRKQIKQNIQRLEKELGFERN